VTIERLSGVLSAIGAPATARELAEILWLACHITPREAEVSAPSRDRRATQDRPAAAEPERAGDQASTTAAAQAGHVPAATGQASQ